MQQLNFNMDEIMNDIEIYKTHYHDLIEFIKKEDEAITFFNFEEIKILEVQKQGIFQSFTDVLNKIINHPAYKMLPPEINDFIKKSYQHVDNEISESLQKLKIEASILKSFFQNIKESSQKPNATYSIYNKLKKNLPSSLTYREI
jgi:hypothetical protein